MAAALTGDQADTRDRYAGAEGGLARQEEGEMLRTVFDADVVSARTIRTPAVRDILIHGRQEYPVDHLAGSIPLLGSPQND